MTVITIATSTLSKFLSCGVNQRWWNRFRCSKIHKRNRTLLHLRVYLGQK